MTPKNSPSKSSWVAIVCLAGLTVLGVLSFFFEPKYAVGLMMIITAIATTMANSLGVKSGAAMPQQAGDAKPGESTQSKTTSEIISQAPPEGSARNGD